MPDVEAKPDLADVPMKPASDQSVGDDDAVPGGDDPADPPAEDLTLPTE